MKKLFIILLISFVSTLTQAQVEVRDEDTINTTEENVTIYKDDRLDVLDKRPALILKNESENKEKDISVYKPIMSKDGKKSVTGTIYTNKGFRIVIYNGADRQKALETKNIFSKSFPGIPSYVSYNAPSYKIKVGNFEKREEASAFMKKVNKAFPTSFIVPDIVTIKNINVN